MPPKPKTRDDYMKKFLAHIVEKEDGCWFPTYSKNTAEFSRMMINGKQMYMQQVAMWLFHEADFRPGQTVYSICPFKRCVNPSHLSYERPPNHTRTDHKYPLEDIKMILGKEKMQQLLDEYDQDPDQDFMALADRHNYNLLIISQLVISRAALGFPKEVNSGS